MNLLELKASQLIRLALADLKKCVKSKKYQIDMGTWHEIHEDSICYVCLAGSVFAQTLKASREENLDPWYYPDDNETALLAIDSFRQGDVEDAMNYLGKDFPYFDSWRIPHYQESPIGFHRAMNKLANALEAKGE